MLFVPSQFKKSEGHLFRYICSGKSGDFLSIAGTFDTRLGSLNNLFFYFVDPLYQEFGIEIFFRGMRRISPASISGYRVRELLWYVRATREGEERVRVRGESV